MTQKLYKFRPLISAEDFCRAKNILETGHFWCSQFSELNDPMEGVFSISADGDKLAGSIINTVYSAKNNYKICSFSGKEAFENPTLWGYYAGGFKGMAIEIEVNETIIEKIRYSDNILDVDINELGDTIIKNILTTKLTPWKHEAEYRFLTKSEHPYHRIGKIMGVYFGNPYGNLVNTDTIQKEKMDLITYHCLRSQLILFGRDKGVDFFTVKVKDCKVRTDQML